jgi:hypothetical protein
VRTNLRRNTISFAPNERKADGYLFASREEDGSLYCEEALATSALAYTEMIARLPKGTVVKLPPDPFGNLQPGA